MNDFGAQERSHPSQEQSDGKLPEKPVKDASIGAVPVPEIDPIQRAIEHYLLSQKMSRGEAPSFYVYDLAHQREVVSINADVARQTASMMKPFVALAFFSELQDGNLKLTYDCSIQDRMQRMIQQSSNKDTNWFIDKLGGPEAVTKILERKFGEIFLETRIVEKIPDNEQTYRNKASATDYARFLEALWKEELPFSTEIRRVMELPGRDRIKDRAKTLPDDVIVLNKTGSTLQLCGDMGILVARDKDGNEHPYIVVGLSERHTRTGFTRNQWYNSRGNRIGEVSRIVYEMLSERCELTPPK